MLYKFSDIQRVDLELSSECNAECPLCPRNFFAYPNNRGYIEHSMTLDEAKTIFAPEFLNQLTSVWINGNFGDMVMNQDTIPIIKYFREHTPARCRIECSTNAGARNKEFWIDLANLKVTVHFCIDGLEDTHSIYRRNTLYSTVIKNAKSFIAAGGVAVWKMKKFNHNQNHIQDAKKIASAINFKYFTLHDHGRDTGLIFNQEKELVFVMNNYSDSRPLDTQMEQRNRTDIAPTLSEDLSPIDNPIKCFAQTNKQIYVSCVGDVYPCCFMGYFPKTYEKGSGSFYANVNHQLNQLIYENNALKYNLEHCIEWFNQIEETWDKLSYVEGRLLVCNNNCGPKTLTTKSKIASSRAI